LPGNRFVVFLTQADGCMKRVLWISVACLLLINSVAIVIILHYQRTAKQPRSTESEKPANTEEVASEMTLATAQERARQAVHAGDVRTLRVILDRYPAIINKPVPSSRATLLHAAAHNAQPEAVKELLNRNADVNALNASGYTPLHDCASRGTEEIAVMLLEKGTDLTIRNKAGLTPLGMAKLRNRPEIEERLRKHGGKE
jgi:hypothetical protein